MFQRNSGSKKDSPFRLDRAQGEVQLLEDTAVPVPVKPKLADTAGTFDPEMLPFLPSDPKRRALFLEFPKRTEYRGVVKWELDWDACFASRCPAVSAEGVNPVIIMMSWIIFSSSFLYLIFYL